MLTLVADMADSILARLDDALDRLRARGLGDIPAAVLLLLPALTILAVFGMAPLVASAYMSLFGGKHGMGSFVGLANYQEALHSPAFRRSFLVTVYYAMGTVPATMLFSFLVAYGLHRIVRGRGFLRVLYFLPYVTSAVAAAMVWRALFNPQAGVFNAVFTMLGLPAQQWLLEPRGALHLLSGGWIPPEFGPSLALSCIILFDIWHGSGFMVVVFLAGLSAIPRELEEAARMDGAGGLRVVRHVVIPLLSPTIFFLGVVGAARAFQAFNSFYALTQGGRTLGTTENLVLHIYSNFYEYGYWGYGTAVAVLLSAAIIALTVIQWRVVGRRVHYS